MCVYLGFSWLHVPPKTQLGFASAKKGIQLRRRTSFGEQDLRSSQGLSPNRTPSVCLCVYLSSLPSSVLATLWLRGSRLCVARSMEAARASLASPRMKRIPYTQSPCIPLSAPAHFWTGRHSRPTTWHRMIHQMPITGPSPPTPILPMAQRRSMKRRYLLKSQTNSYVVPRPGC